MKEIPEIPLIPRTYHVMVSAYFQLSGFPFINAWILSIPVLFMVVLSFYMMSSGYLRRFDRRAPIVSTIIWSFFSGFGWIYAMYLDGTTQMSWLDVLLTTLNKTNLDIGYSPGFWTFMGDNPPVAIGLTSLFVLLYIMQKNCLNNRQYFVLFFVTFAVGYMLHSVEIFFFLLLIPLFFILNNKIDFKLLFISISIACMFILGYDFIYQHLFLASFTVTLFFKLPIYILIGSLIALTLTIVSSKKQLFHSNFMSPLKKSLFKHKRMLLLVFLFVLLYFFALSILILLKIYDSYLWELTLPYRFIPWYFYPVRLGVVAILFLIAVGLFNILLKKYKVTFTFLFAATSFIFLFARLISFLNIHYFDTNFDETRTLSILFMPLSLIASMVITTFFDNIQHKNNQSPFRMSKQFRRKSLSYLIIFAIFVSGFLSTLMTVDYWTFHSQNHKNKITLPELSAMEYLYQKTNPAQLSKDLADYELVFTLSDVSHQVLQSFSGTGSYSPYAYKGNVIFNAKQSDQPFYYFRSYGTSYLYMAQRDYEQLNELPESFLGQYLQFFPKIFENEEAIIYEIPNLSPSSLNSETAIILPTFSAYPLSYSNAGLMFAESLYNYTTVLDSDPKLWEKNLLVLPTDPITPVPVYFEDSFSAGWETNNKNLTVINDGNILELSYHNEENSSTWITYQTQFLETIDASTYQNLNWRVFIEDMVADYDNLVDYAGIRLYDDVTENWFWIGAISLTNPDFTLVEKNSWVDVTFNTQSNNWHKFENVSKMEIVLRVSPNATQKIKIDSVALHENCDTEYASTLTSDLISWVEDGGTLLVVNNDGMGDFSTLMQIQESLDKFSAQKIEGSGASFSIPLIELTSVFINDPQVEVLCYYKSNEFNSPLALRKSIGMGKLYYLISEPYISGMENAVEDDERVYLFSNMSSLLESFELPLLHYDDIATVNYETAIRGATFFGRTTIESDSIIFPNNLEFLELLINSTKHSLNQFKGTLLQDVRVVGNATWVLTSRNVTITSEGTGLYSKMLLQGDLEIMLNVPSSSSVYLTLQENESGKIGRYNITDENLLFKVNAEKPLEILVRTSKISTNGTSNLKSIFIDKQLYSYLGTDLTINGKLVFNVGYSDIFTLISEFEIAESSEILGTGTGKTWDEFGNIPWSTVLFSVDHILLLVILVLVFPYLLRLIDWNNDCKTINSFRIL